MDTSAQHFGHNVLYSLPERCIIYYICTVHCERISFKNNVQSYRKHSQSSHDKAQATNLTSTRAIINFSSWLSNTSRDVAGVQSCWDTACLTFRKLLPAVREGTGQLLFSALRWAGRQAAAHLLQRPSAWSWRLAPWLTWGSLMTGMRPLVVWLHWLHWLSVGSGHTCKMISGRWQNDGCLDWENGKLPEA